MNLDANEIKLIERLRKMPYGDAMRALAAFGASPSPKARSTATNGAGRLPRRSMADLEDILDQVVAALKDAPKGLRAEQLRAKLGMTTKEVPRVLQLGLETMRLIKAGNKRATTYLLPGAAPPIPAAPAAGAAPKLGSGAAARVIRRPGKAKR